MINKSKPKTDQSTTINYNNRSSNGQKESQFSDKMKEMLIKYKKKT